MPLSKTWDQDALSVRSANAADSECQKVVNTLSLYRMTYLIFLRLCKLLNDHWTKNDVNNVRHPDLTRNVGRVGRKHRRKTQSIYQQAELSQSTAASVTVLTKSM